MTDIMVLLNSLSDGRFHSGEQLARTLGMTRAAVWKKLKKLESLGLEVDAVRGKGYRLQQPVELFDELRIKQGLSKSVNDSLARLDVFDSIDSTNRYLMQADAMTGGAHVCLAEMQLSGRGRRGRAWVSPFGCNLYCSIKWQYDIDPISLSGLSLALGVGLMRVLAAAGCRDAGLKWPNDIYWRDKKLAGVLLELSGDVNGSCYVVAGVGLNLRMPASMTGIDQPWTDLYTSLGAQTPGRNQLASALISEWINILRLYPEQGFSVYQPEWNDWDIVKGRPVILSAANFEKQGIAQGVNREGALLLETSHGIETCHAGEISLRVQA